MDIGKPERIVERPRRTEPAVPEPAREPAEQPAEPART